MSLRNAVVCRAMISSGCLVTSTSNLRRGLQPIDLCYDVCLIVAHEPEDLMPDDHGGSTHISLRVPNDLVAAFDGHAV